MLMLMLILMLVLVLVLVLLPLPATPLARPLKKQLLLPVVPVIVLLGWVLLVGALEARRRRIIVV
jgi:hypothetical protein